MITNAIYAGAKLCCENCGHQRLVTNDWLDEIGRRYFVRREPMFLTYEDVKRFKCSSCGKNNSTALDRSVSSSTSSNGHDAVGRQLATMVVAQANVQERYALRQWAERMLVIRDSDLQATEKAQQAIKATMDSRAIAPLLKIVWQEIKRIGWDERSIPAKIGLGAAAFALLIPGKGAAGLAAFGGAIGVPLWIVFGAGGSFAGVIIEEVSRKSGANPNSESANDHSQTKKSEK